MTGHGKKYDSIAFRTAITGVLAALSLVLLYISALVPTGRMGFVAIAGLVPAGAVVSVGLSAGFLCYAVTGILGLILLPLKSNALLYLLFFGLYPMVKCMIEHLHKLPLELIAKLIFLNLMLTILYFGLSGIFMPFLPTALRSTRIIYLVCNVSFLVYDYGFSKIISFYCARIDSALRKSK